MTVPSRSGWFLLAAALAVPAFAADADWLLFRGNALQTGVADTTLPDKLEVLWTFKAKDSIENAPAVERGVVYLGAMDEINDTALHGGSILDADLRLERPEDFELIGQR